MIRETRDAVAAGCRIRTMGRLMWCTLTLAAALTVMACGSDGRPRIPDELREDVRERSNCSRIGPHPPRTTGYHFDERRGSAYPTPAGNRVEPSIEVPLYPGSLEVDGFRTDSWNVQVFEVDTTERELFGFFEKAMVDVDLVSGGFGWGDFGRHCQFQEYPRDGSRPWWADPAEPAVIISTQVVDPEQGDGQHGFPGSTVVYAAPEHGNLVYYVLTER
jgi:hypothetical protein